MKKSFGAIIRKECIKSFPEAPSFAAIHEALIAADPEWKDIKQSSRETYRTDCMGTLRLLEPADLRRMLALAGEEPRERSADDYNSDYGIEPSSPYDWEGWIFARELAQADARSGLPEDYGKLEHELAASDEEIAQAESMSEPSRPAAAPRKGKKAPVLLLPAAA